MVVYLLMWGGYAWVDEEAATWPGNKTPGPSCERTGWMKWDAVTTWCG
jgi:hypothetical protein